MTPPDRQRLVVLHRRVQAVGDAEPSTVAELERSHRCKAQILEEVAERDVDVGRKSRTPVSPEMPSIQP